MTEVAHAGTMATFTKLVILALVDMEMERLGPDHEKEAVALAKKRFNDILSKLPGGKGEAL